VFLLKTFKALNGLLCADVPLRNYSLTFMNLFSFGNGNKVTGCQIGAKSGEWRSSSKPAFQMTVSACDDE